AGLPTCGVGCDGAGLPTCVEGSCAAGCCETAEILNPEIRTRQETTISNQLLRHAIWRPKVSRSVGITMREPGKRWVCVSGRGCIVAANASECSSHVSDVLLRHGGRERQRQGALAHKRGIGKVRIHKSKLPPVIGVLMHRDVMNSHSDVLLRKRRDNLLPSDAKLLQHEKWSVEMVRMARIRFVGRRE